MKSRTLGTVITIKKIEIESFCKNNNLKRLFTITTDTDITEQKTLDIKDVALETILKSVCIPIEGKAKKLACNLNGFLEMKEYEIMQFTGIETKIEPDKHFYLLNSGLKISDNQISPQNVSYSNATNTNSSFVIMFDTDIVNHVIPVSTEVNGKTVNLTSICKATSPNDTELVCSPNENLLPSGIYNISIVNTCLNEVEFITIEIFSRYLAYSLAIGLLLLCLII